MDCSPLALLSMGFPRQEYWRGLPLPTPGDLPDPGIKPDSPALANGFFTTEPSGKPTEALLNAVKTQTGETNFFLQESHTDRNREVTFEKGREETDILRFSYSPGALCRFPY